MAKLEKEIRSELRRRIATIGITILLIYLGLYTGFGHHLLFVVISALTFFAQREFYRMIVRSGVKVSSFWGTLCGFLLVTCGYLKILLSAEATPWLIIVPLLALFVSTFAIQMRRQEEGGLLRIAVTQFGVLYVAGPLAALFWIRSLGRGEGLILLLLVATGLNDIGAYVVGKMVGRHKMAPRISPNKTWEGAIGGIIVSLLAVLVGGALYMHIGEKEYFFFLRWPEGFVHSMILTLIIDGFGLLGDLAESVLKREVKIKDSGSSLTGHGGFLDLVDSLLFTSPVVLIYAVLILPTFLRGA